MRSDQIDIGLTGMQQLQNANGAAVPNADIASDESLGPGLRPDARNPPPLQTQHAEAADFMSEAPIDLIHSG